MAIKVVIADDHPLIADGVKTALENENEISVEAIVSNGKEAIDFIKKKHIDILLLDLDMPILNGIDCAAELNATNNPIKIIILSMHNDAYTIKKVIDLGVKSYLLKTVDRTELAFAIKKVFNGENYFNADVTKALLENKPSESFIKIVSKSPLVETLTKREKEVIKCICSGQNNNQIAENLFISPKTVDAHRTNIMRKLDIHNVVSLVRFALRNNLS